jgi:hypothetical protein
MPPKLENNAIVYSLSQSFLVDRKMNGNGEKITTPSPAKPVVVPKNYKLLVDPMLTGKKEPKVYRYEGVIPGEPPVIVRDPRRFSTALSKRMELLDLPVPR